MKLFAPAVVLFSLGAAKVGAFALPAPDSTAPAVKAPGSTASPHDAPGVIEGYKVVVPEWEVEVRPGEPTIKVSGTVEEVRSELLRQNPNWDTDYPANTTSPKLDKRAIDVAGHFCGGRWEYAKDWAIEEGISYLRRVKTRPTLGPGPGTCERVSCSYQSAIYWCNDARVGKTLQGGFNDVADGAQYLVDRCQQGVGFWAVLSGQVFTTSDWNVIVREDSSKC